MNPRYAVLLDGGFVLSKLKTRLRRPANAQDIIDTCGELCQHPHLAELDLLRIYYYHAPPSSVEVTNPIDLSKTNFGTSRQYTQNKALLDSLELKPNFALRLGAIQHKGWALGKNALADIERTRRTVITARDLVPNLKQKGVDLRIGLDIARLALRQLVQVIVVVTGDSDFVPAFKFARREGVRVFLDHMGHGVSRDLKAHADIIL